MPTSATSGNTFRTGFTLLEVLMALLIIAVLAAFLSRILQSSLRSHQQIKQELIDAPERQKQFHLQLSGELEEPVIELIPVEEEEE